MCLTTPLEQSTVQCGTWAEIIGGNSLEKQHRQEEGLHYQQIRKHGKAPYESQTKTYM